MGRRERRGRGNEGDEAEEGRILRRKQRDGMVGS